MNILTDGVQSYIEIEPVKVCIFDAEYSSRLYITNINDNVFSNATIQYELRSANIEEERDENQEIIKNGKPGVVYYRNVYTLFNEEYDKWIDNEYPFEVIINFLNLKQI